MTVGGTSGADHIRCDLSDVKQKEKCLPLPAVAVRVE